MDRQTPDINRLLPQDPDAEKWLLSAALQQTAFTLEICEAKGITEAHFHIPAHARIYATLLELCEANKPADFITLTQLLRDRGQLEQVGGAAFTTELFACAPMTVNAAYHADILVDKFTLRESIRVCTAHIARCYEEQDQPQALLEDLETRVLAIRKSTDHELREVSAREGALAALDAIEQRYLHGGAISGLATGFPQLDLMTDGLQPAEFYIIAARPSMGKTALAMNMAEHIALDQGRPVAVFSAEMSSKQLHQRLVCSCARVDLHRMRKGFLIEGDFPKLTAAATRIAKSKLTVVNAVGASINALRAKARRLHQKHGLAAIFVDYLQLLRSKSRQSQFSREREISEISQGLKNLSMELNLPVIALAQLNREAEKRTGQAKGRPMLSDLRESGSIEQDADFVGLLVREEYYALAEEEREESEGKATLIIAKQRNGPVGDVPLTFLKELTRFESRAVEEKMVAEAAPEIVMPNKTKPRKHSRRAKGKM